MDFEEMPRTGVSRGGAGGLAARAKRRHAPARYPSTSNSSSDTSAEADAATCARQGLAAHAPRAGWTGIGVAEGVWRAGAARAGSNASSTGAVSLRRRRGRVRGRASRWRADNHRVGDPEQQERISRPMLSGEHRVVPAVLGAGRGFRSCRSAHTARPPTASSGSSTARRCGRRCAPQRLGTPSRPHDLDAPKHKGSPRSSRHAHTRDRGAAIAPDQRDGALQRGVFTRRGGSDACRLGPVNEGWRVANTMLSNERAMIGGGGRRRLARHRHTRAAHRRQRRSGVTVSSSRRASRGCSSSSGWVGGPGVARTRDSVPEASVIKLAASRRRSSTAASCWPSRAAAGM